MPESPAQDWLIKHAMIGMWTENNARATMDNPLLPELWAIVVGYVNIDPCSMRLFLNIQPVRTDWTLWSCIYTPDGDNTSLVVLYRDTLTDSLGEKSFNAAACGSEIDLWMFLAGEESVLDADELSKAIYDAAKEEHNPFPIEEIYRAINELLGRLWKKTIDRTVCTCGPPKVESP
jgi:hypothetical protein